jgi:site-specific DNA-methyltransferase (adenine-specific)
MKIEPSNIYEGDCLELMPYIEEKSIDAVICDLPYGTMKGAQIEGWVKAERDTSWDEIIPTAPLFAEYERVLRRGGVAILFSQEPYTTHLRSFHAKNIDFLYPMIWLKNNHANALLSKNAPVSRFEDINVFAKANPLHDYDLAHPLRPYFAKVMEYIGKPRKQVIETIGQNADHTFRCNSSQFALCTAETYQELIDVYGIDKMD